MVVDVFACLPWRFELPIEQMFLWKFKLAVSLNLLLGFCKLCAFALDTILKSAYLYTEFHLYGLDLSPLWLYRAGNK